MQAVVSFWGKTCEGGWHPHAVVCTSEGREDTRRVFTYGYSCNPDPPCVVAVAAKSATGVSIDVFCCVLCTHVAAVDSVWWELGFGREVAVFLRDKRAHESSRCARPEGTLTWMLTFAAVAAPALVTHRCKRVDVPIRF